ncbi:MAG: GNAT family N-acetyltransferase [Solirubrobacterales bacterium]
MVREIPGSELLDSISPYGYPGGVVRGPGTEPPEPSAVDWSGTGLVSAFVRDRLARPPCLGGATVRSTVQVHDPAVERRLRSRFAEQIRRNSRLGYRIETVPGPESPPEARAAFWALYIETMERAAAAPRYFFEPDYLDRILDDPRSWLSLCLAPDATVAAGAIVAASDDLLHYYLGGTVAAHLSRSPFKNVVAAMVDLSDQRRTPLSLGGGVSPGDGLEDFKRGFANAELPFHTHELVCDEDEYSRLSEGRETSGFFPAYRAGA